jgi:hypothetical protein
MTNSKNFDSQDVKVSTVVASHLNDLLIEMSTNPHTAQIRVLFIKRLLHFHDTNDYVTNAQLRVYWSTCEVYYEANLIG